MFIYRPETTASKGKKEGPEAAQSIFCISIYRPHVIREQPATILVSLTLGVLPHRPLFELPQSPSAGLHLRLNVRKSGLSHSDLTTLIFANLRCFRVYLIMALALGKTRWDRLPCRSTRGPEL